MSIETARTSVPPTAIRRLLTDNQMRWKAKSIYSESRKGGSVYRWGFAAGQGDVNDRVLSALSRMAAECRLPKSFRRGMDLELVTESFVHWLATTQQVQVANAAWSVVWAAALPRLFDSLQTPLWCELYHGLLQFRDELLTTQETDSPQRLLIGGELGLTLAWRCGGLPGAERCQSTAIESLRRWSHANGRSVSAALRDPASIHMVLASLLRCQMLVENIDDERFPKPAQRLGLQFATWAAALTAPDGSAALGVSSGTGRRDDLRAGGLLDTAARLYPESVRALCDAVLGKDPKRGRLSWQVDLPEPMLHDDTAKIAVLTPDWDVRRGKTYFQYSNEEVRLEVFAGRCQVIGGEWQAAIEIDGQPQAPAGDWVEVCEHSDDDVHYLELEQPWSGELLVQRQFMLIRDDRCLLLADSVLPRDRSSQLPPSIRYTGNLPVVDGIGVASLAETREVLLARKKPLVLVVPLAASEWKIGPTAAVLDTTEKNRLRYTVSGSRRLYAPLWLEFGRRRFKHPRTWRQLTVADQLRVVGADEAVGYRVQAGAQQWVIYRSLADRVCRSVLGKHLIADFFVSRFDIEDGGHEELLTVNDDD